MRRNVIVRNIYNRKQMLKAKFKHFSKPILLLDYLINIKKCIKNKNVLNYECIEVIIALLLNNPLKYDDLYARVASYDNNYYIISITIQNMYTIAINYAQKEPITISMKDLNDSHDLLYHTFEINYDGTCNSKMYNICNKYLLKCAKTLVKRYYLS